MINTKKWLKKLCRARDARERNRVIRMALRAHGILYTRLRYKRQDSENLLVRFGRAWDYKHIVGAHYDAVPDVQGANDNAAACIALIQLAVTLSAQGYQGPLALVWFDAEEPCNRTDPRGRRRSGSYLFGKNLVKRGITPELFIILDVVGHGDTLFYSEGGDARMAVRVEEGYPQLQSKSTPGSDDYLLEDAGVPSILLCVLPESEMDDPYPPTWDKLHTEDDNFQSVNLDTITWLVDHLINILESQDFVDSEYVEQRVAEDDLLYDDWFAFDTAVDVY